MEFIKHLPPQLEELHLWIHGDDLILAQDEDFDPVRELAVPIFRTLRRLHTCDVLAFLCEIDGGTIGHPENAVHYRRLPHRSPASGISLPSNKVKDIWVSTMDYDINCKDYPRVGHICETIELGDGDGYFEGHDAKDIWMGGTMGGKSQEQAVDEKMRGHYRHKSPDMTWPGYNGTRFFKYPKYIEAGDSYGRICINSANFSSC
jgi:hypothetical protein